MSVYGHCRHFRGIQRPICEAGIALREVQDRSRPLELRWPCTASSIAARSLTEDRCEKREFRTPAEEEAMAAEDNAAIEAILAGRCPTCGGAMQTHSRAGGGVVSWCPKGCGTGMRGCAR